MQCLSKHPLHGYKLMQSIGENCMNLWHPTAGSLYPALEELKRNGFIGVKQEAKTGRKKKTYEITTAGRKKFQEFSKHIEQAEEDFVKFSKDPELSKYGIEDAMFLFDIIHRLEKELPEYKATLFEFAMLSRHGKINEKKKQEAKKAFIQFLRKMKQINESAKKTK